VQQRLLWTYGQCNPLKNVVVFSVALNCVQSNLKGALVYEECAKRGFGRVKCPECTLGNLKTGQGVIVKKSYLRGG
jgi:hypothetical protein